MRPRAVTRAHTTPRCSRQSSFCSGSQMIAAVERAPERRRAQMLGADHVAFLVDQRADDEAPAEARATSLDGGGGDHRGGEAALHVGAAAAVDPAVDQVGAERRVAPLGRIALGDDVGVALEEQRRRRSSRRPTPARWGGRARPRGPRPRSPRGAASASTWAATAASVAPGSPGRTTLGMRIRSRVSSTSSAFVDTREHGGRPHGGHDGRAYC